MQALEVAILRTLCWFDLQQYPLTSFEVWRYLWCAEAEGEKVEPTSLTEIQAALRSLHKLGVVKLVRGFWQLADSPPYDTLRLERYRLAIAKKSKAARAARVISCLPFVKLVALVNTLANDNANQDSDIDLLIVAKSGRLYLTRLLVTAVMQLLGWRRHGVKVANRICLSFYLADDHLNIANLAYPDDPYLVYWLATLKPLAKWWFEPGAVTEFLLANSWCSRFLPHRFEEVNNLVPRLHSTVNRPRLLDKILSGRVGAILEAWARHGQLYLIRRHTNSRLGDGSTAVVVNESVLKFHESDRRPQLAAAWRQRIERVLTWLSNKQASS